MPIISGNIEDELEATFRRYWAERLPLRATVRLSKRELLLRATLHVHMDNMQQQLVAQLDSFAHAMAEETISVHKRWPADWWQAFKERWLAKWALAKWPVKYDGVDVEEKKYRVCPHLQDDGRGTHLEWMALCQPIEGRADASNQRA